MQAGCSLQSELRQFFGICFSSLFFFLRKEVIQPHLPIRLPCYDLTLIINPTFGGVLLAVRLPTSGPPGSHGVTGGTAVDKTEEGGDDVKSSCPL